jgi:hypothetical protein
LGAYSIPSGDRPSHLICYQQLTTCWRMGAWDGVVQSTEPVLSALRFSAHILLPESGLDSTQYLTMTTNCGLRRCAMTARPNGVAPVSFSPRECVVLVTTKSERSGCADASVV